MRLSIIVIVHPNARNPRVEKDLTDTIHVYVNQPPLEGKANRACVESLAAYLGKKRNQIHLVSGAKSKQKCFEVIG